MKLNRTYFKGLWTKVQYIPQNDGYQLTNDMASLKYISTKSELPTEPKTKNL